MSWARTVKEIHQHTNCVKPTDKQLTSKGKGSIWRCEECNTLWEITSKFEKWDEQFAYWRQISTEEANILDIRSDRRTWWQRHRLRVLQRPPEYGW